MPSQFSPYSNQEITMTNNPPTDMVRYRLREGLSGAMLLDVSGETVCTFTSEELDSLQKDIESLKNRSDLTPFEQSVVRDLIRGGETEATALFTIRDLVARAQARALGNPS